MNLKAPQPTNPARALLCAALIASSCPAFATTPPPRPAPPVEQTAPSAGEQRCLGTVVEVDQRWHQLRLQRYGAMLPMHIAWNSRTTFTEGGHSVTAASLSKGELVTVWYHTPIIGKPIASQILIARRR